MLRHDESNTHEETQPPDSPPRSGVPVWIGLDLGGTTIQGGIVAENGTMLRKTALPTPSSWGADAIIRAVAALAAELGAQARQMRYVPVGVGAGTPGAVDPATGTITGAAPNLPDWVGVPFRERLEAVTELAVVVDNDANMAALGEGAFGAARGCENYVCLTLGTGIGAGIVVAGEILRGAAFAAGEAGHMIIRDGGDACGCGSQGCLEAYASAGALVRKATRALPRFPKSCLHDRHETGLLEARDIFAAAEDGDLLAAELVAEAATSLGAGIAGIVSLLDPEKVVLSGGMAGAGEDYIGKVTAAAARRLMPVFAERLTVVKGLLGDWAGVVGAAAAVQLDSNGTRG